MHSSSSQTCPLERASEPGSSVPNTNPTRRPEEDSNSVDCYSYYATPGQSDPFDPLGDLRTDSVLPELGEFFERALLSRKWQRQNDKGVGSSVLWLYTPEELDLVATVTKDRELECDHHDNAARSDSESLRKHHREATSRAGSRSRRVKNRRAHQIRWQAFFLPVRDEELLEFGAAEYHGRDAASASVRRSESLRAVSSSSQERSRPDAPLRRCDASETPGSGTLKWKRKRKGCDSITAAVPGPVRKKIKAANEEEEKTLQR